MERQAQSTLIGRAYTLTPFTPENVSDQYVHWLNDPEVMQHYEKRRIHQTQDTARAYVSSFYGETEQFIWGIYPNGENGPVGTIISCEINRVSNTGAFGVMIGEKDYWGKGASSEAIDLIAGFTFNNLRLRRLSGAAIATNYGMLFTFKQLGFTLEGVLRKACLLPDGSYADTYLVGLLAEEWRQRMARSIDSGRAK